MEITKFIKTFVREYLHEQQILKNNIKDMLTSRVPFLKQYNIYRHPRDKSRLEAQRVIYNENVKMKMGDDILTFPQLNVSSEIIYYSHKIDDNTFHNFIIKNQFHATQPKEIDDLTFRVFLLIKRQLEKKLSYNKEVVVKNDDEIPKNQLNEIINEMNGVLFKIEDFTKANAIELF